MNKFSCLFLLLLFISLNSKSQVIQSEGFYYLNGKFFSGTYEKTDELGNIEAVINIKNGLPHGTSQYFKNGNIVEKREYHNGLKHGTWFKYENDIKISEANYRKDRKHGRWLIWDENQTLRYEMFYKRGKRTGVWRMWDENGKLTSQREF